MADSDGHTKVSESRILTIPNAISVVRLCCLPLFVWMLFGPGERHGAAWLLGALGATDWVDGWIARRFDQVSELGKLLDPIADRLLFLVGVTAIWIDGSVPAWVAIATLAREVMVSIVGLVLGALGARRIDVTWWGKTGTFLLMFAFPLFLVGNSDAGWADVGEFLAWVCVIPGLIIHWYSAAGYVPIARAALADGRASRNEGSAPR